MPKKMNWDKCKLDSARAQESGPEYNTRAPGLSLLPRAVTEMGDDDFDRYVTSQLRSAKQTKAERTARRNLETHERLKAAGIVNYDSGWYIP